MNRLDLGPMFRRFAEKETPNSPLYEAICNAVAVVPDVSSLLHQAPVTQRIPNLLLAAVHSVLLDAHATCPPSDPLDGLAAFYPSVGGTRDVHDGDGAGAAFVEFCRSHRDELEAIIASRSTQTNEVGRSSALWPVLAGIAAERGPLDLLEVGASAGLNLLLDRWAYEDVDGNALPGGDPTSPVRLRAKHLGTRPPDPSMPIARRRGLDRNPLDVRDPVAARWLLACVWPDELDRFRRTEAALRFAATGPDVQIVLGDAVDDLTRVIDNPNVAFLTIVTTWVLSYLEPVRRAEFVAILDGLGANRDLTWVLAESPMYSADLPWPDNVDAPRGETQLVVIAYRDACRTATLRAVMHPHGRWIKWQEPPR